MSIYLKQQRILLIIPTERMYSYKEINIYLGKGVVGYSTTFRSNLLCCLHSLSVGKDMDSENYDVIAYCDDVVCVLLHNFDFVLNGIRTAVT